MKRSITIKALSLLLIFSIHILTGFTCAAIMQVKAQTSHHHGHQHCCSEDMVKFSLLDKMVDASLHVAATPGHITPTFTDHPEFSQAPALLETGQRYLTNHTRQLPVKDIRIVIRSFQI
ncbi:hypothetical protein [Chitinophaga sp. Cy-1792]|uniref:hypothetical protein n=1 Tax=Chitinophaga sp. Cy-1792 TaxID=2608339 RepID=UPI00141FDCF2|nr:hypothetical protein [Chitinophaga sp. Cy-1792]NIG53884.1 hypothetical protein [Chitinophaga sp. Cy-1792]